MSSTFAIILIAVGAVALFVVGMSLTLMIKGHHIKSEIADNDEMKKRGIQCAAAQFREEENAAGKGPEICRDGDCNSCNTSC